MLDIQCIILLSVGASTTMVWSISLHNVFFNRHNDNNSLWRYYSIESSLDPLHNNCSSSLYPRLCLHLIIDFTYPDVSTSIKILAYQQFTHRIKHDEEQHDKTENSE